MGDRLGILGAVGYFSFFLLSSKFTLEYRIVKWIDYDTILCWSLLPAFRGWNRSPELIALYVTKTDFSGHKYCVQATGQCKAFLKNYIQTGGCCGVFVSKER